MQGQLDQTNSKTKGQEQAIKKLQRQIQEKEDALLQANTDKQ
jgi:hypothetical protein